MGKYLNPGNSGFENIVAGQYVDKTGLIKIINNSLNTSDKLICVSRPRRFGKSFAAKMLCAYYDKSSDSHKLFDGLNISHDDSYEKCINKYNVVYLDITDFISTSTNPDEIVDVIQASIVKEIKENVPETADEEDLNNTFLAANELNGEKYIFIIDEWDALFREFPQNENLQKKYVNLLRGLFKNGSFTDKVVAGAYMTGILPIKKYGTQSAVSDFMEYTMTSPGAFAGYIGFTEDEVKKLCNEHSLSFEEARRWYDGYKFEKIGSVYNPNSLMTAIKKGVYSNYWGKTESYESIIPYIEMDFDGLKQDIVSLLGAGHVTTDIDSYQNDMTSINNKDDVMTLLVHLGYLGYNSEDNSVYIPNEEARRELLRAVKNSNRTEVVKLLNKSDELLQHTLNGDEDSVASILEQIHETGVAPLFYNDEQTLRYVIRFAFISAIDLYVRIEELPSGHGFADVVYLPKQGVNKPALVIELKWDKAVEGAINQIHNNNYPKLLEQYGGDIILVGVSYNDKNKHHSCKIEMIKNQK